MEIPDISIPEIYVPDVPEIYSPYYIEVTKPPEIDVPGCTYQHRDIKNTGNRNLLLDDPNGVYTTCDVPFPSFVPLDYTPENLVITEEVPVTNETPPLPESKQPEIPEVKEDKPIELEPCPSKKDQRVGDFRNENDWNVLLDMKEGKMGLNVLLSMKTFRLWINTSQNLALLSLLLLSVLWLRVLLLFSI